MKRNYNNDPRWIIARFGECRECKVKLRYKRAFFYPLTKDCFCESCGDKHARDFAAAKFDEDFYNSLRG